MAVIEGPSLRPLLLPPSPSLQALCSACHEMPGAPQGPHLEGGGSEQLSCVDRFWEHVCNVGYEFLKEPAGSLQVCCVDDNLDQLQQQQELLLPFTNISTGQLMQRCPCTASSNTASGKVQSHRTKNKKGVAFLFCHR